jgi:antitoxin (DNA-binding transcriptional repressor) of toxin-antitoxin stability system
MKTVTVEGKRVARLTGGEGGPARGGVGSGRFWRSQRGTARRRGWSESAGQRLQQAPAQHFSPAEHLGPHLLARLLTTI